MNLTNLRRGCLEGCILEIIRKSATHSYDIFLKLKNQSLHEITPQSIYTITKRLERNGLIHSAITLSPAGPNRRVLSISEMGLMELERFKELWKVTSTQMNDILLA